MPQVVQSIVVATPLLAVGLALAMLGLSVADEGIDQHRRRHYRGFPRLAPLDDYED